MVPVAVLLAAVLLLDAYWSWQARSIPPAGPIVAAGKLETPAGPVPSPARSGEQTPSRQPAPAEQPSSGGAAGQQGVPAQPEPEPVPASGPAPSSPSAVGSPAASAGPEAAAAGSPSERSPAEGIVGDGLYPAASKSPLHGRLGLRPRLRVPSRPQPPGALRRDVPECWWLTRRAAKANLPRSKRLLPRLRTEM